MIRKQVGGTEIILIPPKFEDSELPNYIGTFLQPSMIDIIIDHDADVYSTDGTLLAKFRKSSINPDYQDLFTMLLSNTPTNPAVVVALPPHLPSQ